jgi:hypothetical protein
MSAIAAPLSHIHSEPDEAFEAFIASLGLQDAYTKAGVCALLGKSEASVDRLVRAGELRAFRVGGSKLTFLARDIAALLFRRQVETRPSPAKPVSKPVPPDPRKGVEARKAKQRARSGRPRKDRKRS